MIQQTPTLALTDTQTSQWGDVSRHPAHMDHALPAQDVLEDARRKARDRELQEQDPERWDGMS